jgi:hypothetical protein
VRLLIFNGLSSNNGTFRTQKFFLFQLVTKRKLVGRYLK